ncbi:hypothetical protein ACFORL_11785 [Legionella dresdenensis]|uniref:Uncharacterized protein n=1 Tax=Legionella dresdenensis TaxID=450200 RepID=A0ABV8CI77_9GAMM
MKSKGFLFPALLLSTACHANFMFQSFTPNVCDNLAGNWAGSGKASNWIIGTCSYHGTGTISAVDSNGRFSVKVSADKDSGNLLCPAHAAKQLTGTCLNGIITIITEYGDLAGNFSENNGQAKGTLTVAPGIKADVLVNFQRVK